jgi:hypothetical protein
MKNENDLYTITHLKAVNKTFFASKVFFGTAILNNRIKGGLVTTPNLFTFKLVFEA